MPVQSDWFLVRINRAVHLPVHPWWAQLHNLRWRSNKFSSFTLPSCGSWDWWFNEKMGTLWWFVPLNKWVERLKFIESMYDLLTKNCLVPLTWDHPNCKIPEKSDTLLCVETFSPKFRWFWRSFGFCLPTINNVLIGTPSEPITPICVGDPHIEEVCSEICVFPFTLNNRSYTGCTKDNQGKRRCAGATDMNGNNALSGDLFYCRPDCPIVGEKWDAFGIYLFHQDSW